MLPANILLELKLKLNNMETKLKQNKEPQNLVLSKCDVMPRELSLHNYWDSKTSEDRVEIVERAFKMIEKQKEYIAVLNEELNGLVGMASVHGWKSNLVEQGKKLRDEMALLHGAQRLTVWNRFFYGIKTLKYNYMDIKKEAKKYLNKYFKVQHINENDDEF
ncbi:MAG: hypothetical protein EOM50_24410, partial [Erysipelotrichia bacterium]|nr:hypothetical protein [Erysipelotrichia bacterium]